MCPSEPSERYALKADRSPEDSCEQEAVGMKPDLGQLPKTGNQIQVNPVE